MKKHCIVLYSFWILCIQDSFCLAVETSSLIPGSSGKEEVESVLGNPQNIFFSGIRYEYKSKEHNYERILVTFDPDTHTVVAINYYFQEAQKKAAMIDQFDLDTSVYRAYDAEDNLIEYYYAQGVSLHYDGQTDASGVLMARRFEKEILKQPVEPGEPQTMKQIDLTQEPGVVIYHQDVIQQIGKPKRSSPGKQAQTIVEDKTQVDVIVEKAVPPQKNEKLKSDVPAEKVKTQLDKPPKDKPLTQKEKPKAPVVMEKEDKKAGEKDSKTKVSPANDKKTVLPKSQVIFEDSFDKDNAGRGSLRYRGFSKWYVPVGEVDLLGNGFGDELPGYGLYVDLAGTKADGAEKTPGMLQSKQTLELAAGRYRLSLDLKADGADKREKVSVWLGRLGNIYKQSFAGSKKAKFERKTAEFKLDKDSRCRLSFICRDAQESVLIDNIKLEKIVD